MKNQGKNTKFFFIIVGVGILVMLILGFNHRIATLRRLKEEAEVVGEEVLQLEATKVSLETQITQAKSEAAVEKWAYEKARMIREGDHLIAPISPNDDSGAPEQPLLIIPEPQSVENWKVWKALFFDRSLP
jgi:cell division protein FtsB